MADFRAVPGQTITYVPGIESFIMSPGTSGDVALWGGGPGGKDLDLFCWDQKIVQVYDVTYVSNSLGANMRRIRLTAQNIGVTVIEARLGEGGPAWAKAGVAVGVTPAQSPLLSVGQSSVLSSALTALDSTATNFGVRFIQDARVRANYIRRIQEAANEIRLKVEGKRILPNGQVQEIPPITPEQGAREANELRNAILDAERINSSDIGRAVAQAEKATGLTMEQLQTKYASELFGREFSQLAAGEQDQVFLTIIRKAGTPNPRFNAAAARLGWAGKGLLIASLAFAVYRVASSDNPGREAAKQGADLGLGFLGSVAGGAAAGLVCGPGAPICVGVGAFVGGVAFAVGSDFAFDWLWK